MELKSIGHGTNSNEPRLAANPSSKAWELGLFRDYTVLDYGVLAACIFAGHDYLRSMRLAYDIEQELVTTRFWKTF